MESDDALNQLNSVWIAASKGRQYGTALKYELSNIMIEILGFSRVFETCGRAVLLWFFPQPLEHQIISQFNKTFFS